MNLTKKDWHSFRSLNGAFITLLLKKLGDVDITDFRPISLLHSMAKIFSKALYNLLAPKLNELIATY